MRRAIVLAGVCLTACLTLTFGGSVQAFEDDDPNQISCGNFGTGHDLWQGTSNGHYIKYLIARFWTTRENTPCMYQVRVEGYIDGVTDAGTYQTYGLVAWKEVGASPPTYGTYTSRAKHWVIWGFSWQELTPTTRQITMITPTPEEEEPEMPASFWNDPNGSPLLFDMNHDGFRLTSMELGVDFDINADGIRDRVAWTEADSDDAWLAFDRNGDGVINHGGELFGNHTRAYANGGPFASNGFEALSFLETPAFGRVVSDGFIDAKDDVFGRLLLWTDVNHNGVSERSELKKLAASQIERIGAKYEETTRKDAFGNLFKLAGSAFWRAPGGRVEEHVIYDVFLVSSLDAVRVNSIDATPVRAGRASSSDR
jgi:hypothetical protein